MARVLVTGGTGFLGRNMAQALANDGDEVYATHLRSPPRHVTAVPGRITYRPLDLVRTETIQPLVEQIQPDRIYHFAGQAYVVPSWEDPLSTFSVNVRGTLALLEAVRRSRVDTGFVFAGSGTEYGAPTVVPTPEDAPLLPTSPYATSKAAADLLCYQYFQSYGLPTFRLRIFGTTGVGKLGDVCNDFASQFARFSREGGTPALKVGDLDKQRDLMDVEDAVRAMRTIADRGVGGEAYNVGSGTAQPLRTILSTLERLSGVHATVEPDPTRFRKVDEPVHLGDITRLRGLGWAPRVSFDETLRRLLVDWRSRAPAPAT